MNFSDTLTGLAHFFNDIIGSVVPGLVFLVGLAFYIGLQRTAAQFLTGTALDWVLILAIAFAIGHLLLAIRDVYCKGIIIPLRNFITNLLRRSVKGDSTGATADSKSQVLRDFRKVVSERSQQLLHCDLAGWSVNDLRNLAMTVSPEAGQVGRRFMFLSLLCGGVATSLLILATISIASDPGIDVPILLFAVIALERRSGEFYKRAKATPFTAAYGEVLRTGPHGRD